MPVVPEPRTWMLSSAWGLADAEAMARAQASANGWDVTVEAVDVDGAPGARVTYSEAAPDKPPATGVVAGAAAAGAAIGAGVAGPLGAALGGAAGAAAGLALGDKASSGPAPGTARPATARRPVSDRAPYLATAPDRWMGQVVPNGQCVAYVKAACGAPQTSAWRRGERVKGNPDIPRGAAIATFDPDGTYGNHTDQRSHAAVYIGQDDRGLTVYDQWKGQAVHQRVIRFGGGPPVNNGDDFHVIA